MLVQAQMHVQPLSLAPRDGDLQCLAVERLEALFWSRGDRIGKGSRIEVGPVLAPVAALEALGEDDVRICLDAGVAEPCSLHLGSLEAKVLDTPGHTMGHIAYWIPAAGVAFVGDTLFAMGCGRVLEGTAEMMW
ncbi:MAG TPA: MBL fold metallo-hydrolase, partial [Burkholderiaceae bacterium]|nr:MBL fold metallo-hydrolase [Burkholderiaceae bacterium]